MKTGVTDFLRFYLIGADRKTRWRFGAPGSPVRLARIPEGLQGAAFEHDFQQVVGVDGGMYRGTTDLQAEITLQLWVADNRSSAWARRQHALWRESLGRGKSTARLYVISKESGYWWIDVRVDNIAEVDYMGQNCLPGAVGEIGEIVRLVSERSYWRRFDETRVFDRDTCRTARLVNVGDQPAWLQWAITGQHDGVDIGVEDDIIHLPGKGSLDPGYLIDTDPVWPSLQDTTGADIQDQHPDAYWSKPLSPRGVHRGNNVGLTIKPTNPGSDFRVEVQYNPRTEAAW